ncbi:hypothetical protein A2U01_0111341, partial [Trifolium medium]|nr:hypothetical protein [Trifolium medium]
VVLEEGVLVVVVGVVVRAGRGFGLGLLRFWSERR